MADAIAPKVQAVENMVKRAREITRDPNSPACPVCHVKLWISLFFDGTGNHREKDFPKCHSNVAALFHAHLDDPKKGIIRLYYEGLGRKFSFRERYEERMIPTATGNRPLKIEGYEESDNRWLGKGFADGITERLEKAVFDFTKTVEDWRALRKVDEINLAVFGFSRGATEARAFLHWLPAHSKVKKAGLKLVYDGLPLNVKFLGVFDTVESVGGAGTNKKPETIKTKVPPFVEKCTHIVAAHELRAAFPLTEVNSHHKCVVYPGAHADVGGGYAPEEQGRSNQLARIALLQMLDEARSTGLKMRSLGEMKGQKNWEVLYRPSFDVPQSVIQALNHYMAAVGPSGNVVQHFQVHMDQYWRWIDAGLAVEDVEQKRKAYQGNKKREKEFQVMRHLLTCLARTPEGRGSGANFPPKRGAVAAPVEHFFENYVHDSFEHFSMTGGTLQTDISNAAYYQLRTRLQPAG
ncbi:DUF2235 domain-containing protein [Azonexus sp.]|jgi:hypothetical protein|uniref:T6SS phospholipase effector Tle1-like catalytic domain-containing protein n=1 Tax=Azonexus sp. TaxID=1872668 RepID=UPI00282190F4|nr:DUF2235 domain-containing protein [Azonexus sp.]MDR1994169.1 DUF2235 domain-containing protein [Azonexus sp.]